MSRTNKPYKPTKNVLIKDVPKAHARLFNLVVRLTDGYTSQTQTETFNKMIEFVATEYLGEERARERLKGYQELEDEIKERSLRF